MYRIYINETVLMIAESISEELNEYQKLDSLDFNFQTFYEKIKNKTYRQVYVLLTTNAKRLFKHIKKRLFRIDAAGGVVRDEQNKYLFIYRRGKWDLPKGKIDEGEKTKKAAVREVEEECGIHVDNILHKLTKTWHVYELKGRLILKKTTWYLMQCHNQPNLSPQLEEEITDAKWLALNNLTKVKKNTYPLILDLINMIE